MAAFGRDTTTDEVLAGLDLSGRHVVITGAAGGLGRESARAMAAHGASVTVTARDRRRAQNAVSELRQLVPGGRFDAGVVDLGDFSSIRSFTDGFLADHDAIDVLINNAGVMACPFGHTVDGFETQFGTNYLGHFLLTELLLERLKAGAPSRIVCVSSVAHVGMRGRGGELHLDDLNGDRRPYDGMEAYAQSKLAIVLQAVSLARRLEGTGVTAVSVHPGWIRSNLVSHTMPAWVQNGLLRPLSPFLGMLSAEDGAQTTLHCLLADDVPAHAGAYYSQNSILYPDRRDRPGGWPMPSPNPRARDGALAEALYQASRRLVGLG